MKIAIVFFSRDGSTKIAAQYIAKQRNNKNETVIVELQTKKPLKNFLVAGFTSASKKLPELAGNPWGKIEDCECIVLAAPVWAGNGNPVLNSFIDRADFSGKKLYVLTLQADPSADAAVKIIPQINREISDRGGKVAGFRAIQGALPGKTSTSEHIQNQLRDWKLEL